MHYWLLPRFVHCCDILPTLWNLLLKTMWIIFKIHVHLPYDFFHSNQIFFLLKYKKCGRPLAYCNAIYASLIIVSKVWKKMWNFIKHTSLIGYCFHNQWMFPQLENDYKILLLFTGKIEDKINLDKLYTPIVFASTLNKCSHYLHIIKVIRLFQMNRDDNILFSSSWVTA